MTLLIANARVVSPGGAGVLRGRAMRELTILPRAHVLVESDRIARVLSPGEDLPRAGEVIDARARALVPGFVDCHTHALWAGERLDEWEMKLAGRAYLEILRAGGGIMSTVRAVRRASQEELAENLRERLDRCLATGTTTIEVKSGYGLSTRDELKMLRAIREAARGFPGTVVATALLGHALDPDVPDFVERTIRETLPAVSAEFPGIAVDAFCEQGAWSREQCAALFEAARARGHPIRVHADQFNSLGMVEEALRLGARSVDHLEASTDATIAALAGSATIGVALPLTGLHLSSARGGPFARGRALVDAGAGLALATNCNPGSSPSHNVAFAVAAGVRFCGLTPHESLSAVTANAAGVLGFSDRGRVEPGQRADLVLCGVEDERRLALEWGDGHADVVIAGGRVAWRRAFPPR